MTGNTANLVLEILKRIQADPSILRNALATFRTETRERLNRVGVRLSVIERTLGNPYALSGSDRETLAALTKRVEHTAPGTARRGRPMSALKAVQNHPYRLFSAIEEKRL